MNAETRARELLRALERNAGLATRDEQNDRIAAAIRSAENDKLEEAAASLVRASRPRSPDGSISVGAELVMQAADLSANHIRSLKSKDTPVDLVKTGMEAFERGLNTKRKD